MTLLGQHIPPLSSLTALAYSGDFSPAMAAALPHRCTIQTAVQQTTEGAEFPILFPTTLTDSPEYDDGGHAVREWTTVFTSVPCRLMSPGGGRETQGLKETSLSDYRLALPLGLTVAEFTTRAVSVVDEYGRAVGGSVGDVFEVLGAAVGSQKIAGGVQVVAVRLVR